MIKLPDLHPLRTRTGHWANWKFTPFLRVAFKYSGRMPRFRWVPTHSPMLLELNVPIKCRPTVNLEMGRNRLILLN
jgi:hypothetical protein